MFVNSSNVSTSPNVTPPNGVSAMAVQAASGNTRLTTTAPFRIVGLNTDTAVNVTAAATTSSTTLTLSSANSNLTVGMQVFGPGIFQGSYNYITAISGTTVTLANAVTTAQSTAVNFTFFGCPEVKVKWNFGYHSYYAAAGV